MDDSDLAQNPGKPDVLVETAEENTPGAANKNEPWLYSKTRVPLGEGIAIHNGPDAQHSGIHVSSALNEKIDAVWRAPNGWYQGVDDFPVAISFPERFTEQQLKNAHLQAKEADPESYQAFSAKMFENPDENLGYTTTRNYHGEGISLFETPIETRLHVTPELNERIDETFRNPDGWYDDPGMRSIIAVSLPERFDLSELAEARQNVKDLYPDIYEGLIGETPAPRLDDQDDINTSAEGSANKEAPGNEELMSAFDLDADTASKAAAAGGALETDTKTEETFDVTIFNDDTAMLTDDLESVDDAYIEDHGGIYSKRSYNRSQAESLGIDLAPMNSDQSAQPSNSFEGSAERPSRELKDLIAAFDSEAEPTGKITGTPETAAAQTPANEDVGANTTSEPVAENTTEKQRFSPDKNQTPSTTENTNTAATKIDGPLNSEQSRPPQGRNNDHQQSYDRTQQPVIAPITAAGVIAATVANAFRGDPSAGRPAPQAAEPAPKEPAPSPAQPQQNPSAAKPETPSPAPPAAQTNSTAHGPSNPVGGSLALRNLLTGFRPERSDATAPQESKQPAADTPAKPGSARALLDRFNNTRMQPRRDTDQLEATERAGEAAVKSFEALEKADSSAILTRIREAAEAAPGGMKEVLSEMRPGGAYEDLRKEFNATLARDENFSAAYENAAGALDAFADQREKAAPILQNGNAGLLARLEALDQQIVKASAEVPGKEAGKSNLDEALQNGREALTQAFETIRNVFSRHSPSASPGMSP
ncbi:hypothetical protein [uncultured Rhodoblastus sp.]|uniref:DUF7007 domain-containing protein n=1 Tax=uncultured Rhodoblastus sp. TaxID=543037 RepID=UPI0025F36DB8|nr:hypothetical protein [uncultured Rhodoblastus sp.]